MSEKWRIEVTTKAPGAMEKTDDHTLVGDAWFTWEDNDFTVIEVGTAETETEPGEGDKPAREVPQDNSIRDIQAVLRVPTAHVRCIRVGLAPQDKAATA